MNAPPQATLKESDFLILRTPLLPFSTCTNLSFAKLKAIFSQPLLQEALFIASPQLHKALQTWLQNGFDNPKDKEKMEVTLTKYLLRMSYRCTPFGLFAGVSMGKLSNQTTFQLAARNTYQRYTRLDMDYLCALALHTGQQTEIKHVLTYFPNTTLYKVGEQMRYVEYQIYKKLRRHNLVNIDYSEYIQKILTRASQGATPLELASVLVDEEITLEEALEFVIELIDSQVLVSSLEPSITGEEYMDRLARLIKAYPESQPVANQLAEIKTAFLALDRSFEGNESRTYDEIIQKLEVLEVPFEPGQLFQVDVWKPVVAKQVNYTIVEQLQKAVELLAKLSVYTESGNLKNFREAFYKRYEEREVPLLEVLDSEMGLGYPFVQTTPADYSPLLDDIQFEGSSEENSYAWSAWQQFLLAKYSFALQHHLSVIDLQAQELAPFLSEHNPPLPSSFYSMGSLFAASPEAIDKGEFQLLHRLSTGPSGARLLGRFCYMDKSLTEAVKALLQEEEIVIPRRCLRK